MSFKVQIHRIAIIVDEVAICQGDTDKQSIVASGPLNCSTTFCDLLEKRLDSYRIFDAVPKLM